jgi:branched-chain amino acid transport system permease protein
MQVWYFYFGVALVYMIFTLSLNLLLGYAGQVSAAHAAFGAVGGFLTGYLLQGRHWNIVPAVGVGTLVALVVGALVALPALKLSVEYLILLTLAMSAVIIGFFTTFDQLGGINGLVALPKANLFGWTWRNPSDWMLPLAVAVTVVYAICWRIGESPYGRVLKGIREDDLATRAQGKNVFRFKVSTFAITSGMAGFGGGLLASFFQLSTPGLFGFSISLSIIAMVIFGGMANLTGSVLGAGVLSVLDPILNRAIGMRADQAGFVRLIAYGLLLIALVKLRPQGLVPEGYSIVGRLRGRKVDTSRLEMVRVEGWTPKVPESVAALAEAEEAYLEHGTTIVGVGATKSVGGLDPEVARERLWEQSPVILEVQNLTKRFGGIVAAEDLSMTLRKGTITALVGPNGAGKTTVFNLLTGFIRPDAGSVRLNGEELIGRTPDHVARRGMVRTFQDVRLFQRLSCLQNVQMAVQNQPGERLLPLFFQPRRVAAAERATTERAMESLRFVGMQEFAHVPTGALSYGQSKLISLARALASDAGVLLLDEPASGIDTQWVDTMLALIESLREQGRTICIVEHNLHVVGRLADHTYFMELGRISAEGTIDELTSSERLAEAYFGTVQPAVSRETVAASNGNGANAPVLDVKGLQGGYGRKQVVFDIDFHVDAGEVVTILGHNGSGKSTTIKTILGLFPNMGGEVTFFGKNVSRAGSRANVKAGMALIPSERFVFPDLSVLDNLLLGGANELDPVRRKERMAQVYELFPVLKARTDQLAGTLSGGEQRMLSLGLLLMAGPKLLMLDEPSLGLAPVIVQQIFDTVRSLAQREELSVLLLEQNVGQALQVTDRVYVMRSGRVILEETADQMRARPSYWDLF